MPGLDKTGPTGQGARTGRTTGRCNQDAETETGSFFLVADLHQEPQKRTTRMLLVVAEV